ncbi:hypothetical protein NDU88_003063 [Pleurodeles waltl]|uniref:Uncharacterized protein n=1 Tax=Pleurodeles waltl TaxID=8319 RepID=A0AAV7M2U9_PLEWA|nr:hypothetical protein NDU88_003063 [Pleurodeles waltl]
MQHTRAGTILQNVGRELTQWCLAPRKKKIHVRSAARAEHTVRPNGVFLSHSVPPNTYSVHSKSRLPKRQMPENKDEDKLRNGCRSVKYRKTRLETATEEASRRGTTSLHPRRQT